MCCVLENKLVLIPLFQWGIKCSYIADSQRISYHGVSFFSHFCSSAVASIKKAVLLDSLPEPRLLPEMSVQHRSETDSAVVKAFAFANRPLRGLFFRSVLSSGSAHKRAWHLYLVQ